MTRFLREAVFLTQALFVWFLSDGLSTEVVQTIEDITSDEISTQKSSCLLGAFHQ
jgi:hypothetical protein